MRASECVGVCGVKWLPICKYTQGQLNYCSELAPSSHTHTTQLSCVIKTILSQTPKLLLLTTNAPSQIHCSHAILQSFAGLPSHNLALS